MAVYAFATVDVFTSERFGGNPLAVFPEAGGLSDEAMQALAAEFNLSETTFVLPPDSPGHTARVRIFNPKYEMAFAGHPNVGTAYVLASQGHAAGDVLLFEEIAGLVEVRLDRDATHKLTGATVTTPQALSLGAELPPELAAACSGLPPADILTADHPPVLASVGHPFLVAEVSEAGLARAMPDPTAFRRAVDERPDLAGRLAVYLYARGADRIRTRMFSPLAGVPEDPATGSAAAPLAGLLLSLSGEADAAYEFLQGVEMGRPSLLRTTARRAPDGIRTTVGGDCVPVLRGEAMV